MSKIVVNINLTLDGVMQAPGRPDEDTRGGFAHGGWATARSDEAVAAKVGECRTRASYPRPPAGGAKPVIDAYAHIIPPRFFARLEERLEHWQPSERVG